MDTGRIFQHSDVKGTKYEVLYNDICTTLMPDLFDKSSLTQLKITADSIDPIVLRMQIDIIPYIIRYKYGVLKENVKVVYKVGIYYIFIMIGDRLHEFYVDKDDVIDLGHYRNCIPIDNKLVTKLSDKLKIVFDPFPLVKLTSLSNLKDIMGIIASADMKCDEKCYTYVRLTYVPEEIRSKYVVVQYPHYYVVKVPYREYESFVASML